jgi:hypothetical protein
MNIKNGECRLIKKLIAFIIVAFHLLSISSCSLAQNKSMSIIRCDEDFDSHPAINFDIENNIYLMIDGKILKYNQTGSLKFNKTLDSKGRDPSFNLDSEEYLHIVYSTGFSLTYNKLNSDGEIIFSKKISDDSELSDQPNIVIDSKDNIHITWLETKSYFWEVCYIKFDNNGNNLINEKNVSSDDGFSSFWGTTSCLNTGIDSNNNIHLVWGDVRDFSNYQYSLYYSKLDNNGSTIIDDKRINYISNSNAAGILLDSDNNINIIWTFAEYNESITEGPTELHFTKLSSNGDILIKDKIIAYQDFIGWPSIDIDSRNNITIVWYGGFWAVKYHPISNEPYCLYINGTINMIEIDNNGNILENTTEYVEGNGYTAISFNHYDSPSILWSNDTGTYLSLPEPITLEDHEKDTDEENDEEIIIVIAIIIIMLIIIFISYELKRIKTK